MMLFRKSVQRLTTTNTTNTINNKYRLFSSAATATATTESSSSPSSTSGIGFEPISHRVAPDEINTKLPNIIQPLWSMGYNPDRSLFTIDMKGSLTSEDLNPSSSFATEVAQKFDDVGLVHIINTGTNDLSKLRLAALLGMRNEMLYEGGSNPREAIVKDVFEAGAPLTAWLHYHHEMSYIGESTRAIAFLCKHSPGPKGATYVSDGVATTDYLLQTDFGMKLKELGVCYHRKMTDREAFDGKLQIGVYNHWQLSLLTDDPEEAEAKAKAKGLITSWGPERRLDTRYYIDAFEFFPHLNRNLLYASHADHGMWFDAWPLVMHLPYEERPLHLTWGNDTEFTHDELQEFVTLYDRYGISIPWKEGEIAILCNIRWAHGRPGMTLEDGEKREIGVVLGEKYQRQGQDNTKW